MDYGSEVPTKIGGYCNWRSLYRWLYVIATWINGYVQRLAGGNILILASLKALHRSSKKDRNHGNILF